MLNVFSVDLSALIDDSATAAQIEDVDQTFRALGYKVLKEEGHTIVVHPPTRKIYVSNEGWLYLQSKYADPDRAKVDAFAFKLTQKIKGK